MAPFKGAGGETWRARQGADGDVRRPDSGSSPGRPREGDGPDRWGPPVGGCERGGEADWAKYGMGRACGMGRERGREKKRKRKREWAGLKDIGKEREVSIFLTKRFKQFNSNLNSREFKLELNNKQ